MLTTTEGAREKCEDIIWSVHLDILRLPLHTVSLGYNTEEIRWFSRVSTTVCV